MGRMPASVQVEDLIQAGMLGLLEAAQKFDHSKGASFETYAGIRIKGAIVDEIRRGDWVPRSVHRNSRKIMDAAKAVEAQTGRDASDSEIAAHLNMSLDEYHAIANDVLSGKLFSYNEVVDSDDGSAIKVPKSAVSEPDASAQEHAIRTALAREIDNLPEREKLVLSLYYDEELNLKEIGLVLGVSESRVSQLHSQAALRLKKRLSDWSSKP